MGVIGRGDKNLPVVSDPMIRGGNRKVFFAFEVMKKRALGDAGRKTQIVDAGRRIPLGPNDRQSGIQNFIRTEVFDCNSIVI